MGVGPPGRTGRDQLDRVREFVATRGPGASDVVLIGCARSAAGWGAERFAGAPVFPVDCAGSLHTSVVEYLIRAGAGGVMIAACPSRDCWNREGVNWLELRLYEGREAELQERVDRTRLRLRYAAEREGSILTEEVKRFASQIRSLERALSERAIEIDTSCERPSDSLAEERV
jgi:coenzyme F420-reducing hydrogenase delta subunit